MSLRSDELFKMRLLINKIQLQKEKLLDKYNTAEGCIPCKGDPKRKL